MSFRDNWAKASKRALDRAHDVFVNSASHAYESIVNGSAVTGAPGQPVDTGRLRNSWQLEFLNANTVRISTKLEYAKRIEMNVRGVTFKNHGPHSVKLTRYGFDRIVMHEINRLNRVA